MKGNGMRYCRILSMKWDGAANQVMLAFCMPSNIAGRKVAPGGQQSTAPACETTGLMGYVKEANEKRIEQAGQQYCY